MLRKMRQSFLHYMRENNDYICYNVGNLF